MKNAVILVVIPNPDFQFLNNETVIAVGLSGGGDSMALLHMASQWAAARSGVVHALTVDHGLRPDSGAEAEQVASWVRDWPCVQHHILRWVHDGDKPQSAVMESARTARYGLMNDYCRAHGITTLCVAHHADDQIETFLFRLAKGSGLDGLSGMAAVNDTQDGVRLCRPLLSYTHDDLIEYCRAHNIPWVEDPSNKNENYARPRLRQSREVLEGEGLSGKRLYTIITRLQRAASALDTAAQTAYDNAAMHEGDAVVIDWFALSRHHDEIIIRVLQKALTAVGHTESGYPPKLERVEIIAGQLTAGQLQGKAATLYGCLITHTKSGDKLEIVRS